MSSSEFPDYEQDSSSRDQNKDNNSDNDRHENDKEDEPSPSIEGPDPEHFYSTLQLPLDASTNDIQQAYYRACQTYHPDKLYNISAEQWKIATDHMQKINMAYFTLSEDVRRAAYLAYGMKGTTLLAMVPADLPKSSILDALKVYHSCEKRMEELRKNASHFCQGEISVSYDWSGMMSQWEQQVYEIWSRRRNPKNVNGGQQSPSSEPEASITSANRSKNNEEASVRKQGNQPETPTDSTSTEQKSQVDSSSSGSSPSPSLSSSSSSSSSSVSTASDSASSRTPNTYHSSSSSSSSQQQQQNQKQQDQQQQQQQQQHNPQASTPNSEKNSESKTASGEGNHDDAADESSGNENSSAQGERKVLVGDLIAEDWWPAYMKARRALVFMHPENVGKFPGWVPTLTATALRSSTNGEVVAFEPPTAIQKAWVEANVRETQRLNGAKDVGKGRSGTVGYLGKMRMSQSFAADVLGNSQLFITGSAQEGSSTCKFKLNHTWAQARLLRGSSATALVLGPRSAHSALQHWDTFHDIHMMSKLKLWNARLPMGALKYPYEWSLMVKPNKPMYRNLFGSAKVKLSPAAPKLNLSLRNIRYRQFNLSTNLIAAPNDLLVHVGGSRSWEKDSKSLTLSGSYNPLSKHWFLYCGARFKLSNSCALGLGLALRADSLHVILTLQANKHSLKFPICVSRALSVVSLLTTLAFTVGSALGTQCLLVSPMQRWTVSQRRMETIRLAKEKLAKERDRAMTMQLIMKSRAVANLQTEQSCNGLVILSAQYGCLRLPESVLSVARDAATVVDVTVPCQLFVRSSRLTLYSGTKGWLDGFYDTDPLKEHKKYLKVEYEYDKQKFTVEIEDEAELKIPVL